MNMNVFHTAFLFIDLQNDFLHRPGVLPDPSILIRHASSLMNGARSIGAPVIHIHTAVSPDGSDAMPHWKGSRSLICVKGTPGALAPQELMPLDSERIVFKSFYSGFENGELEKVLDGLHVEELVISGLYTHACIRSTALDAYAKGYKVAIALDAIASPEPLHAEITRDFLEKRGIPFLTTGDILRRTMKPVDGTQPNHGSEISTEKAVLESRSHHTDSVLSPYAAPSDETRDIDAEITSMRLPRDSWQHLKPDERIAILECWRIALLARSDEWIHNIVREVDKPLKDARDEFKRALSSIQNAIDVARLPNETGYGFHTAYRPIGTVAIITPWNNPMAIPIGKLAPALLFGNAVIWKPSPFAERMAEDLLQSLLDSGLPGGLIKIIKGDAEAVRRIVRHPLVSAVSLTGSHNTGRVVRSLCSIHAKPLQAELGGNNAVIVRPDAVLTDVVPGLVRSVFGFSGQRCTATRRIIVDASIETSFIHFFTEETRKLVLGLPQDEATDLGPLISEAHTRAVADKVAKAIDQGAKRVYSGTIPNLLHSDRWYPPTVLVTDDNDSDIVQQETFGPVVVIQVSVDMDHALRLADGVSQGLVAGMVGGTAAERDLFQSRVSAGILNIGSPVLPIDMQAPFSGWKESSIGIPEHGRWDRDFFSRVQAVYG